MRVMGEIGTEDCSNCNRLMLFFDKNMNLKQFMNLNSNTDYSLNCDSSLEEASCFVYSPSVMPHKDDWASLQRMDVVVPDVWPNKPFDLVFPFYTETKLTGLHVGLGTT